MGGVDGILCGYADCCISLLRRFYNGHTARRYEGMIFHDWSMSHKPEGGGLGSCLFNFIVSTLSGPAKERNPQAIRIYEEVTSQIPLLVVRGGEFVLIDDETHQKP